MVACGLMLFTPIFGFQGICDWKKTSRRFNRSRQEAEAMASFAEWPQLRAMLRGHPALGVSLAMWRALPLGHSAPPFQP